ncbi:MAG: Nramp family divalent metal transporter [Sporichthyaceae bacterium]
MSQVLDPSVSPPDDAPPAGTFPLGVSRPPLEMADLPTPEEVWGVPQVGRREILRYALGPSVIALGVAIGGGEWLLGPLTVGQFGFIGIGWIITVAAVLQTIYNVELGRYVIATGEVPVVGFARVPPGRLLWVPLSLFAIFFAFILGGWAKAAAKGLFALVEGRVATPADSGRVNLLTFALLGAVLVLTLTFRRITRGMELINATLITVQLSFLLILCILVVPASVWWEGVRGLVTPAMPPDGVSATNLGALAGFTALAAGLNWFFMSHYRDKGYGMGHRVGALTGVRGGRCTVRTVGFAFPDNELNAARWTRWMRLLRLDMYGVFLPGAIIGMLLPTILMFHLAASSGTSPTAANVDTFAATVLGAEYGRWLFYATLFIGFLIFFDTQLGIFEALVRNATDAANISPALNRASGGDLRRFYFPFMVVLLVTIGYITTLTQPATLIQYSANVANAGALIFPFAIMYLNSKLPRPARPPKWVYGALVANTLFFGFFFLNFIVEKSSGSPLITF